jgi:hypothetical protein
MDGARSRNPPLTFSDVVASLKVALEVVEIVMSSSLRGRADPD